MNQFYRTLHTPPDRLWKMLLGGKETTTIAVRPLPPSFGCAPLPALGGTAYTPLPPKEGACYAEPVLFTHQGDRRVFCTAYDEATGHSAIAACTLDDAGCLGAPQLVLQEPCSLAFPLVFAWNGEVWMLPDSAEERTVRLYHCDQYPDAWSLAQAFDTGRALGGIIVAETRPDSLTLLCSEEKAEDPMYARYRRYYLRERGGVFELEEDEAFNLQHRAYDLNSRSAGPMFRLDEQDIHAVQVSTRAQRGVYLQFYARRAASEVPLCAATPRNLTISGLDMADVIGLHTYCRDDAFEVIDARYLKKPPRLQK